MIKSSSHNCSYHFDLRSVLGDRLVLGFCMEFLCSCASLSSLLRFICIDRQILRFAAEPQWFPWKSDITWPIFSLMCKQNNQRHSQSPRYDREARALPTPSAYTTISTCLWSAISLRALLSEVRDLQRDLSHTHTDTMHTQNADADRENDMHIPRVRIRIWIRVDADVLLILLLG